jgi:hypothetical protein
VGIQLGRGGDHPLLKKQLFQKVFTQEFPCGRTGFVAFQKHGIVFQKQAFF